MLGMVIVPCSGFPGVLPRRHNQLHRVVKRIGRVHEFTAPSITANRANKVDVIRGPFDLRAEPTDSIGNSSSSSSRRGGTPTSSSSSSPLNRPSLALLDLISLLAFAAVGKASHAVGDGSFLEEAVGVARTAFPFVVSWFVTSFATGVYGPLMSDDAPKSSSRLAASWAQTAKGWAVAIPLGCVGRGLLRGYAPPVPFVVVTMIATLVILGVVRMAYYYFIDASEDTSTVESE